MSYRNHKGFTLIELLVVIAIIGLLSTLAVVALNNAREKSRDAKRVSDIKQVQTALELYFADQNGYPSGSSSTLGGASALCLDEDGFVAACDAGGTTYMGAVPANPAPGGAAYTYNQIGSGSSYSITFSLESGTGGLATGAHTATPSGLQ